MGAELLDLERDVPTTRQDVAALARWRRHPAMDLEAYFRFLSACAPTRIEDLAARRGPRGPEPFVLPDAASRAT